MAARATTDVGELIDGRFLVVEHVRNTPAMVVYRAEHSGIGRSVELWLLDARLPHDGPDAARMLRVARASGAVTHGNVQSLIDSGSDVLGRPYLAYEWLAGERLSALLARTDKDLPPERIARILLQIIDGARAFHEAGVVHRAIAANRVVIVPVRGGGEVVKLTGPEDAAFLAERVSESVTPERLSSPYLAPELRRGEAPPDARQDVYSLGVLLRSLLTGHPRPAPADALGDTARRAIERATADDPDDRFGDVDGLANAVSLMLPDSGRPPRDEMPTPRDPLVADLQYLKLRRSTVSGERATPLHRAHVDHGAMLLAIEAIYKRIGEAGWDRLVARVPEVDALLSGRVAGQADLTQGVPVELVTRTLAAADDLAGNGDLGLVTELGEAIAHRGLRRMLPDLPATLEMDEALQALGDLWRKVTGQGHVDVMRRGTRRARVTVRDQSEPSLELCALMAGVVRGTMREVVGPRVEVYTTACQALGDPQCVLGIGWDD